MLLDLVKKSKAPSGNNSPEAEPAPAQNSLPPTLPPAQQPQPASTGAVSTTSVGHSVLGSDIEVKGSIRFSRALVIDGRVEGDICSDGTLTVGEHAVVKGEIKTRAAIILGKVEGNITTQERCELRNTATLVGDIAAGTLSIEEGAAFTGQSRIGKRPNAGKSAPDHAEKPLEILPAKLSEATPAQPSANAPIRQAA